MTKSKTSHRAAKRALIAEIATALTEADGIKGVFYRAITMGSDGRIDVVPATSLNRKYCRWRANEDRLEALKRQAAHYEVTVDFSKIEKDVACRFTKES